MKAVGKQHFLQGALVLSLAGLVSKILGAVYRVPLARLLGGEGLGLYQMAYPLYTMILAISTAGIPVAISILVAEKHAMGDREGGRRVFRIALLLLSLMGAAFSLLLFLNSYFLACEVLHNERAFYPVIAISPAIFFTAVMSAFRGYFQGQQLMSPTAWSQVLEQLVRVTTVLGGALFLLPYGLEFAAAGATFGAVAGSVAALVLLIIIYWVKSRQEKKIFSKERKKQRFYRSRESVRELTCKIISIGLPLSVGGLVMPIMQMIDATMVPLRLQEGGYDIARATELFGQFSGMAVTLVNLPTIVTSSLAVSLVPAVAEAVTKRDHFILRDRMQTAIRLTILICLPAAVGLWILAAPIGILLYDLAEVGESLAVLAPAAFFLGLYQATAGALQGLGKTFIPVRNLMFGAVLKIFLNYHLTAISALGIKGAAISTVAGFVLAFGLNYVEIKQRMPFNLNWSAFLPKPFLAVTIMAISTRIIYEYISQIAGVKVAAVGAIGCGIIIYLITVVKLGELRKGELYQVPIFGRLMVRMMEKIWLIR